MQTVFYAQIFWQILQGKKDHCSRHSLQTLKLLQDEFLHFTFRKLNIIEYK